MKNFTVIHILLFILLMLVYQCTHAQDMVITNQGDTLIGEVKQLNAGFEKKVQVTGTDKKKKVFSIFQTRSYTYKGEVFHPVKKENTYLFMKVKKAGYLSLYEFQLENKTTYDGLFLTKKDGSSTEVPNLGFKKYMRKFLEECPDVRDKIDKNVFAKRDIELIVDEFNHCIESNTVDHNQEIVKYKEKEIKVSAWDKLEEKVKNHPGFDGKSDALEMIGEIKSKINRGEKIPNFLTEGLKSSMESANLTAELDEAIQELGK